MVKIYIYSQNHHGRYTIHPSSWRLRYSAGIWEICVFCLRGFKLTLIRFQEYFLARNVSWAKSLMLTLLQTVVHKHLLDQGLKLIATFYYISLWICRLWNDIDMQTQSLFLPVNTQWKQNVCFRLNQVLRGAKQTRNNNPKNHTALSSTHTAFPL